MSQCVVCGCTDTDFRDYAGAHLRGRALCVATLADCRPMVPVDETASMVSMDSWLPAIGQTRYSWVLRDIKRVTPFPIIGKQRLFKVNESILRKADN